MTVSGEPSKSSATLTEITGDHGQDIQPRRRAGRERPTHPAALSPLTAALAQTLVLQLAGKCQPHEAARVVAQQHRATARVVWGARGDVDELLPPIARHADWHGVVCSFWVAGGRKQYAAKRQKGRRAARAQVLHGCHRLWGRR